MRKAFFFVILAVALFACSNNNNKNVQGGDSENMTSEEVSAVDLPADATITDQTVDGNMVLYIAFTDEDIAYNKENNDPEMPDVHNTLFLLDKKTNAVKTVMTMSENLPDQCFSCDIQDAVFTKDGSRVFIVNNPNTGTYFNVLCYDIKADRLIYLSDGDGVTEGDDGLYYVEGAKGYDWEEGGAFWFTRIVTPDGQSLGGRDTIY